MCANGAHNFQPHPHTRADGTTTINHTCTHCGMVK